MKKMLFSFLVLLVSHVAICQKTADQFKPKRWTMDYVGDEDFNIKPVGNSFDFRQKCTKDVDSIIVNGEVIFEDAVFYGMKNVWTSLVIKNGILVRQSIQVKGKNKVEKFLSLLSLPFESPLTTHLADGYSLHEVINTPKTGLVQYDLINTKSSLTILITSVIQK